MATQQYRDDNYIIKRSNGKIYATIAPNTIIGRNQPTQGAPINLLGRNKVNTGVAINENFLHLAENFAGIQAPMNNVKGLIWYKYIGNTDGQLLIALVDGARNPVDEDTEQDWASIPMITLFNTLPESESSLMGRMVLTNNADSLMVLMKDKEWREIQTNRPMNKELDMLLDINYDVDKKYISFTNSIQKKDVTFFNNGAALGNYNGFTTAVNGPGALHYGSNYFYELKIMAREVEGGDNDVDIQSKPENYKTWIIKGSFYVENDTNSILAGTIKPSEMPDPRRIKHLYQIVDVIDKNGDTESWNVGIEINAIDSLLPDANSISKQGYENYFVASLNSKKHLGFKVIGDVSDVPVGKVLKTQWSVLLRMIGIPPVGV